MVDSNNFTSLKINADKELIFDLKISGTGNATFGGDVSLTSGHELTVNNAANNNNLGIHIKNDNNFEYRK